MPNNEHAQVRPGDNTALKQIKNNDLGEVSEWLKEHAWKVCIRQRIEGSNPSLSAIQSAPISGSFRTRLKTFKFQ